MKKWIHASTDTYTSMDEVRQIIENSIPMTKGRKASLYAIEDWNIAPEDAKIFAEYMKFQGPKKVKSIFYDYSPKHDLTFLLEYEDGSKRLYGFDQNVSTYDGSLYYTCSYIQGRR